MLFKSYSRDISNGVQRVAHRSVTLAINRLLHIDSVHADLLTFKPNK